MNETEQTEVPEPAGAPRRREPSRRHFWRFAVWIASGLFGLGILAGVIVASLGDRTVTMPDWVTRQVEVAINRGIAPAHVTLSSIEVTFRRQAAPSIAAIGASIYDAEGRYLAYVPRTTAALDRSAILEGRLSPQSLQVSGMSMLLRRDASGQFAIAMGQRPGVDTIGGSPAEIIDKLNRLFDTKGLEALNLIEARDMSLVVIDEMSGRRWDISQGLLALERSRDGADMRLTLSTTGYGGQPARVALSVVAAGKDLSAQLGASIRNLSTADIAALGPALSWLRPLDAPASGSMRAEIAGNGDISAVHGALDIGRGTASIPGTEKAVAITKARAYFDYDPAKSRIQFTDLALTTSALDLTADGQMFVNVQAGKVPELITQLQFSHLSVKGEADTFVRPAQFDGGGTDFRLRFDPFRLEIGQFSLATGPTRIVARGKAEVDEKGLSLAADLSINRIGVRDFLALWPRAAIHNTRDWVVDALSTGQLSDMRGSLRVTPGADPVTAAGFQFSGATLRWLPGQAPITGLTGYATLEKNRFTVVADAGHVTPAQGGVVDITGTVLTIPDVTINPATAQIALHTSGSIASQLSILDTEPFEFLKKAGQRVDLASGTGKVDGRIDVRLVERVLDDDVTFDIAAALSNVASTVLVPGYRLTAKSLTVTASRQEGLRISGKAELNGVPLDGEWALPLGPGTDGASRLTAAVEVSQATSEALKLGLPPRTLKGTGVGRVEVAFQPGQTPHLRFFTDMNNVAVSVPPLGYVKPPGRTGKVEVQADLASPPKVDSLTVDLPGLSAVGAITLTKDGALDRARLTRVRVGRWFDGPVDLIGRGAKRPVDIAVLGGRFDIRNTTASGGGGGGSGGGGGQGEVGTLSVRLDRFVVSDSITLTGVSGKFSLANGLSGPYTGRINGRTPVKGTLAPSPNGTKVTMTSDNGGGVLHDAGLVARAQEGAMTLTLVPRGKDGFYDGALEIRNVWIGSVPALAELVSAVSVVGLLEQMSGKGILFTDISARFALTPTKVVISTSRAEGASIGLTMDGSYDLGSGAVDMQGVVTPVYLINGIGQLVSRRGEGLIGMSYRMKGTFANPDVSVNPLSLLTPGFLRDIFRRPLPKIGDEPAPTGAKAGAGN